ncbi:MAG TPA: PIN domain-containing protein [Candidatus Limnocylindria bacterium]
MKLLADTGALLALFNPRDTLHQRARTFARQSAGVRFVLTDLILSETVTRLRARTDAARAADIGAALLNSRRYEVLFVDPPLVEAGLADLRRFADKRLSLVDAVSFAVIRSLALDGSFTFDRDFRDCGFTVYPDRKGR